MDPLGASVQHPWSTAEHLQSIRGAPVIYRASKAHLPSTAYHPTPYTASCPLPPASCLLSPISYIQRPYIHPSIHIHPAIPIVCCIRCAVYIEYIASSMMYRVSCIRNPDPPMVDRSTIDCASIWPATGQPPHLAVVAAANKQSSRKPFRSLPARLPACLRLRFCAAVAAAVLLRWSCCGGAHCRHGQFLFIYIQSAWVYVFACLSGRLRASPI